MKFLRSLLFVIVLVGDQVTKYLALQHLSESKLIQVIPGVFNLTLVFNRGAAFGMFGNLPDTLRRVVLVLVSAIALVVVFRFMCKEAKHDRYAQLALVAILSGAIGNIIDRVRFDAVVDFLDFYYGTYHWPAFNIADSAISLGVFVLVLRLLFGTSCRSGCEQADLPPVVVNGHQS